MSKTSGTTNGETWGKIVMPEYLNVFHIYTKCEDDVSAITAADDIKIALERDILDCDDGETVDVIQTIPVTEDPTPSATIVQLRRARNILLRTRTKENYDLARAIDQAIWQLASRYQTDLVGYDWGKFVEVMKEVVEGGNPLEY